MTMPDAIQVHLQAGETVFYNNNILHCATYDPAQKRATLHACISDVRGGAKRARNILQHDLQWMDSDAFVDTLPEEGPLREMRKRLVDMAQKLDGQDVGYSQVS